MLILSLSLVWFVSSYTLVINMVRGKRSCELVMPMWCLFFQPLLNQSRGEFGLMNEKRGCEQVAEDAVSLSIPDLYDHPALFRIFSRF